MILHRGYQRILGRRQTCVSEPLQQSIAQLACFLWKKFTGKKERELSKHKYKFQSHVVVLVYSLCHGLKDWLPTIPEIAGCMPSIDRISVAGFNSRNFSKSLSFFTESFCELMKREPEATSHRIETLFSDLKK